MAKQAKIQNKLKSVHRARKGKACPACGRRMKREQNARCQFEGGR